LVKSLRFSISGFLKLVLPLLPVLFLVVFPGSVCADSATQPNHATEKGLSLIEAVRDTIQKQPDVLLQQQEVASSEGCFYGNGTFRVAPLFDLKYLEEIFRYKVFKMLLSKGKITEDLVDMLMKWRHSGFNVFCGPRIQPGDESR